MVAGELGRRALSKKPIQSKNDRYHSQYLKSRLFFGTKHGNNPEFDRKPTNDIKDTHGEFRQCMLQAGFSVREFDAGDDDSREAFIRYALKRANRPGERKCWVRLAGEWARVRVAAALSRRASPTDEDIPF